MNRQKIDVRNLWNHLRVIDKDVPRTDRDLEYFKSVSGFINLPHIIFALLQLPTVLPPS